MNKFIFIKQNSCWAQPNDGLNSEMFYLDKLHFMEKESLDLAKSVCGSMEPSHKIVTRSDFKTSFKSATAFQLNNAEFLVLSSKSAINTVSDFY